MEEVAGAMSSGTAPGAPRAASAVGVPSRTGPLSQSAEVGFCHAWVRTWETHSWVTMALGVPFGRLQGVLRENPQCGPARGQWGAGGGQGAPQETNNQVATSPAAPLLPRRPKN